MWKSKPSHVGNRSKPVFTFILLRQIVRNLEDYGFFVTAKKMGLTALASVVTFRSYLLYVRNLQDFRPSAIRNTGLKFRWIRPEDDREIEQIERMEEWLSGTLKSGLTGSVICLAAMDHFTVAGFNLINLQRMSIPLLLFERKLPPNSAWSEHISVHKNYRKRGLGSDLRNCASSALEDKGIKRFYGSTQPDNSATLKLAANTGFHVFCRIYFIKVLFYKKWFFRRLRCAKH